MDLNTSDPRLPLAATCPRCNAPALAGTGRWSTCPCGRSWPVDPTEVGADDVGTAAFAVDRLRRYLHGPVTAAERAAARRRAGRPADDRWSVR